MQKYFLATVLALSLGLGSAVPSIADEEDDISETTRLDTAKISLGQALEIAERDSHGKAIEGEFNVEHNRPVWEIKVLSSVGLREYEIDTQSGEIAKTEDEPIHGRLYSFVMGVRLKDVEAAKTSAVEAIAVAERQTAAKAVFFEVEREYRIGQLEYEIVLRSEGKRHRVRIEAATGQIVSKQ